MTNNIALQYAIDLVTQQSENLKHINSSDPILKNIIEVMARLIIIQEKLKEDY